jgi:hypothetical protein
MTNQRRLRAALFGFALSAFCLLAETPLLYYDAPPASRRLVSYKVVRIDPATKLIEGPIPNANVHFSCTVQVWSGGHFHSDGGRPCGTFGPTSALTDYEGIVTTTFFTPNVSGKVTITARADVYPNYPSISDVVIIGVGGLSELPNSYSFTSAPYDTKHPLGIDFVKSLVGAEFQSFAADLQANHNIKVSAIKASLIGGGLNDTGSLVPWEYDGFGNLQGREIDIEAPKGSSGLVKSRALAWGFLPVSQGIAKDGFGDEWHLIDSTFNLKSAGNVNLALSVDQQLFGGTSDADWIAQPMNPAYARDGSVQLNFVGLSQPQQANMGAAVQYGGVPIAFATGSFYDPAGLQWVQVLTAAAPDGGGQPYCFIHYDVNGNGLWLYGDNGYFVGPVTPGTPSNVLQNSLCAINTQNSFVTLNQDSSLVELAVAVTYKSVRTLNTYAHAMNNAYGDTGWVLQPVDALSTTTTPALPMLIQPGGSGTINGGINLPTGFGMVSPDPPGWARQNFGWDEILIAAAPDGGGQPFCFAHFDRAGNGLWMYSSDVGYFLGPVAPGDADTNVLDSSACHINPAAVTWNTYTDQNHPLGAFKLNVGMTFKSPMVGLKNVYTRRLSQLNIDSGWVQFGALNIMQ